MALLLVVVLGGAAAGKTYEPSERASEYRTLAVALDRQGTGGVDWRTSRGVWRQIEVLMVSTWVNIADPTGNIAGIGLDMALKLLDKHEAEQAENEADLLDRMQRDHDLLWGYSMVYETDAPMFFRNTDDLKGKYGVDPYEMAGLYKQANWREGITDDKPIRVLSVTKQLRFMGYLYDMEAQALNRGDGIAANRAVGYQRSFNALMKRWAVDGGWCNEQVASMRTGFYKAHLIWLKAMVYADWYRLQQQGTYADKVTPTRRGWGEGFLEGLGEFFGSLGDALGMSGDVVDKTDEALSRARAASHTVAPEGTPTAAPAEGSGQQGGELTAPIPPDVITIIESGDVREGDRRVARILWFMVGSRQYWESEARTRGITQCEIDFGDGSLEMLDPTPGGERLHKRHVYRVPGLYHVRARAINARGDKSVWSEPTDVTVEPFN